MSSIGRGATIALLYHGFVHAGLRVDNCELACRDDENEACVTACQQALYERQPAAVKDYVTKLYTIGIPCLQVAYGLIVYRFPIRGERLRALTERQRAVWEARGCEAVGHDRALPSNTVDEKPQRELDPPASTGLAQRDEPVQGRMPSDQHQDREDPGADREEFVDEREPTVSDRHFSEVGPEVLLSYRGTEAL